MPPVRRRSKLRPDSPPLALMRLAIGSWWPTPEAIDAARHEYAELRDELLAHYPPDEVGPSAFWSFEPRIPARLRHSTGGRAAWLRGRRW